MSTIIKHREFSNYKTYSMDLAGRPLTLEVGKLAELANASVLVRYGDTVVLVCATASAKPRDGIDFFPLSVDFEEKMYSVGRIPDSFNRREGHPGEKVILTSRVIDRPIRPLFPGDFCNDVSIMATVMSVDHDCSPEIAALIGTSAALAISDIPWNGPVGAVKMGLVDGELVINPTSEQRKVSDLDVTVVSTGKKVVMIEAGANEVDEDTMLTAIKTAHVEIKKIIEFINKIVGGAIPKEYIEPVNQGIQGAMQSGILAGYPVVDVKVTLYDGSYHEVDSSEMAFKIAGSMAFKEAMKKADPVLMEPIMQVDVMVPEEYMGDVIGDLNSRRGQIQGMEPRGGVEAISAGVMLRGMPGYALVLRSPLLGSGQYTMQPSHYTEVPKSIQEKIIDNRTKNND